jgi:protein TonB
VLKSDAPPTVARVERQPEVKAEPRAAPVLAAPQRPESELVRPAQPAPRVEPLTERTPQPSIAPPRDVRPDAPPPVEISRAQPRQPEPARSDIAATAPVLAAVPQQNIERRAPQPVTAPETRPPEISRPLKPEPPVVARAEPPAPKRNIAEEKAAIERFAREITKQFDVSERDYPRQARDRHWQGTTYLVLSIQADGKLGGANVATSSGFEILDRRALELMNRVKLPPLPPEIQSRAFTVRVPVRFALRE